jgi:hypothetical protein
MSPSEFCVRQKLKTVYMQVIDKNIRAMKARKMSSAGHMANMGERRAVNKAFGGKPLGKRSLGRPRR